MWLILWGVAGDVSRYIVQMMPCVLAGAVLFFILRPVRLRRLASKGLESPPLREMGIFLFMLFCAGMAALTVFPSNLWSYVLSPGRWPEGTTFWSFYPTITEVSVRLESLPEDLPQLLTPFPMGISYHFRSYWSVFLFLGNIGMFLPIGFSLSCSGDKGTCGVPQ